jgi:hypothetical protein
LHQEGVKSIATTVVADLRRLPREAFWVYLDNRGWLHPFDERGRRRSYDEVPKRISSLVDDPFRSLGRRAAPERRLCQGHHAVQRISVGGFPAPAASSASSSTMISPTRAGPGIEACKERRGGFSAGLVRADRARLRRVVMNASRALHLGDAVTGLSLAGLLLPEAVAYSGLANLPPQAGVIGLFAGLLAYALIGRSRYAIVTATSSSAAVLAAATLALGADTLAQRVAYSSILVCATGIAFLLAGSARLGAVSNLIARPVLRGFSFGLALVIVLKQWPHIVALHTHSTNFFALLAEIFRNADSWAPISLATGAAALLALFSCERIRRVPHVPGVLLVIVAGIAAAPWLAARGVALTGPIHLALEMPTFATPANGAVAAAGGVRVGADVHSVCGIL